MNIYQNIEVYVREYDSKLLSSIYSAKKGNVVLLTPKSEFCFLLKWLKIPRGIFHDKSLTPSEIKLNFHKKLKKKGFLITSLDEEHGLHWNDYSVFGKRRFSNETIDLCSYVFCWGNKDHNWLRKNYSKFKDKFILSGAPRVDFWKNKITTRSKRVIEGKYIFYPSNFIINNIQRTWEISKLYKSLGFDKRDPEIIYKYLNQRGEQYLVFSECIRALEYLAYKFKDLNFIVRPHPRETLESWKVYLEEYKNIHIIKEGSITDWIKDADAVIHNGCTSALEATVSNIPVITFQPIKNLKTETQYFNGLGYIVNNKEEIELAINRAINSPINFMNLYEKNIIDSVNKKVYLPKKELSSEVIPKYWENLKQNFTNSKNIKNKRVQIYFLLLIFRFKNYFLSFFNIKKYSKVYLNKHPGISKKLFFNKFKNLCKSIDEDHENFSIIYISPRVQMISKK